MSHKASILEHPTLSRQKQSQGLLQAIEITEQMLNLVAKKQTVGLADLEAKRNQCLDECLALPAKAEDFGFFSDALKSLLMLNEELMSLIQSLPETHRDSALEDFGKTLGRSALPDKRI